RDELLRAVRAVSPRRRRGVGRREARGLRPERDRHDRGAVPGRPEVHRRAAVRDAEGHRGHHRALGGEHLPRRALARAALLQPPGPKLVALPDAGERPVDVRVRDASGWRDHGRAGADRGARVRQGEAEGPEGRLMARKTIDTIVIGAGHNGLVAAAYLAKGGRNVLVLERAERTGGILRG